MPRGKVAKVQEPLAFKALISCHIAVLLLELETTSEHCVGSTAAVTHARNRRCKEENLSQLTKRVKGYREVHEETMKSNEHGENGVKIFFAKLYCTQNPAI